MRPGAGRRNYWAKRLPSTLRGPVPCFAAIGVFYSTRCVHNLCGDNVSSVRHVQSDHSEHTSQGVRCCVLCSTGHTEDIAGIIKTQLGDAASDPEDIGDIEVGKLAEFDSLVVGELVSLLVSC